MRQRSSITRSLPICAAALLLAAGCRGGVPANRTVDAAAPLSAPFAADEERRGNAQEHARQQTHVRLTADTTTLAIREGDGDDTDAAPRPPAPGAASHANDSPLVDPATLFEGQGLSLFECVELGLRRSPELTALRKTEGVSRAAVGVAETYPYNPNVQAQVTPFQHERDGGVGSTSHYVLVMQTIELAHQGQHRESAARAALEAVRWNIVSAEWAHIARTERLFFTAIFLRDARDLARTQRDQAHELLSVVEKQLAAGEASGVDAATTRLEVLATTQQARLAEANLHNALLDLRTHLGLSPQDAFSPGGELGRINWRSVERGNVPQEAAVEQLAAARPDVLAARQEYEAARARACLAGAARVPDLIAGPYYARSDGGTTFFGMRAQMDMPIWNNGRPLLCQRQAEAHQRCVAWDQLRTRAALEAGAAIERYERAQRLAAAARAGLGDDGSDALARLQRQYLAGDVDLLRLVTARASLLQFRRALLDVQNELAQAGANVTAAAAISPGELLQTDNQAWDGTPRVAAVQVGPVSTLDADQTGQAAPETATLKGPV